MTRDIAHRMLIGMLEPTPHEADLITDEYLALMDLAAELGRTDAELLATMTASAWTRYRARAIVQAAQQKVTRYYTAPRGNV